MTANHDLNSINWVAGMSDPGEMIACGAYQQLRRLTGETDEVYQERITVLLADLPKQDREKIMKAGRTAAIRRASLDYSNGKVSCFTAGEKAWHGLGVNVSDCQTSAEAIVLANLAWDVLKEELFLANGVKVPGAFALVREDTGDVFGTCSAQYNVFQNRQAFSFMDELFATGEAVFETAGAIKGGSKVWMMARLPKTIKLACNPDDETVTYILLVNDHSAKGSLRIIPTTVRVCCANSLNRAVRGSRKNAKKGAGFALRHNSTLKGRVAEARSAIGLVMESMDTFEAELNSLAGVSLQETDVTDLLHAMFPVEYKSEETEGVGQEIVEEFLAGKDSVGQDIVGDYLDKQSEKNAEIIEEILEVYASDPTCNTQGAAGTAYGLLQAMTAWCDHKRPARGKDDDRRAEQRASNNFFGPSNAIKQDAYATLMRRFKN